MGLGIKFYQAFLYAMALHTTALVGLYFSVLHIPQTITEKSITINIAAAPEAEYFQSSIEPQKPEAIKQSSLGESNSNISHRFTAEVAAKGKKLPRNYLQRLQASVQEASHIPQSLIHEKISGNAVLRLSFERNGAVLNYSLVQKSGYKILDKAAIATGENLLSRKFPPAPKNFERGEQILTYDFPISFNSEGQL